MRQALLRTDQKTALRVVRQLEATGGNIQERVVYSELGKAARSSLSSDLEWRISDWVSELDLDTDMKERVQNVLLGQRAEEIEHILEQGRNKWWTSALCKKETPQFFLLGRTPS
ncbi:unnamed protein product [Polarella glacialis]|uniref:Uncharacterized protein n=1 Tax=Polarella glacialis TaxID=89957 RepID=A0A813JLV9_POLGL|nr:unnamed protein product [Polarella glacialis]